MHGSLRRASWALLPVAALLFAQVTVVHPAGAGFDAAARNGVNSFSAAATFPNYQQTVAGDAPSYDYRMDDASGAITLADSSASPKTGSYDGTTTAPAQWWRFDENAASTTYDRAGGGFKGSFGSSVTWGTGKYGSGVTFPAANLTTGYVRSSTSAIHTDRSFSVAAWVNIADTTGVRTAVSQGNGNFSGFYLKYQAGQWQFAIPVSANPATGAQDAAVAAAGTPTGQWVHLVGVYDAAAKQLTLYVNNVPSATVTRAAGSTNWDATGGTLVGESRFSYNNAGILADPWIGSIDDVRFYNRALSAADVGGVYAATDTPPVADWRFDDGDDVTQSTDASGNADRLTLTGVTQTNRKIAGANGTARAVNFDGVSYGQAAAAVVRTDQSFTVAAWLRDTDATLTNWHKGVTQPGAHSAGFVLEYRGDGKFGFSMANSDVDNPVWSDVYSTTVPAAGTWYHVAGVYDAAAGVIRMYVNGVLEATAARATPTWNSTGNTLVARGIVNSVYTAQQWVGGIDSVVLYQRALSTGEVGTLKTAAWPAGTTATAQAGALGATSGTSLAVAFNGTAGAYYPTLVTPTTADFSLECWFRTDSIVGGTLLGFANPSTGQGQQSDKHLYLNATGQVTAGFYSTATSSLTTVSSPASYNDGLWHHVVLTASGTTGAVLYVDGSSVATSPSMTVWEQLTGYWRIGGESIVYWPGRPSSDYFVGLIDEVAIYPSLLTPQQVSVHYYAGLR